MGELLCKKLPGISVLSVDVGTGIVDITAAWVGVVSDVGEDSADTSTETTAPDPEESEEPKLLRAVVDESLATSTFWTITTSPFTLVTLTSTVLVPKPLEYW